MSSLVSSCRMLSSKPVVEFSMANYLLEMEKRLGAAQKDLKNDLQAAQKDLNNDLKAAQTISEQRMEDSKKDLKNDLQAAQKDLKNDLQAAQTISEQRMLNSQKQQIYTIVFLGARVYSVCYLEIGMKVFGFGITKLD